MRRAHLTTASTIIPARVRWLWTDRIPAGTLTVFAGRGGEGKSTFALWVTAMLNTGRLPGEWEGTPSRVLIASLEDDWPTVMVHA